MQNNHDDLDLDSLPWAPGCEPRKPRFDFSPQAEVERMLKRANDRHDALLAKHNGDVDAACAEIRAEHEAYMEKLNAELAELEAKYGKKK